MTFSLSSHRRGFTLIELIIVIAIIAIIAAGVFVALDPAKRLNAGRNATRWSDVTAVLKAVKLYQADSPTGALPTGVTSTIQILGTGTACNVLCTPAGVTPPATCVSLSTDLAPYLSSIPMDPSVGTAADTRYWIVMDATTKLITVGSCNAQGAGAGGSGTPPAIKVAG